MTRLVEADLRRQAFTEVTGGDPARKEAFASFQRWLPTVPVEQVEPINNMMSGFLAAIAEAKLSGELPTALTNGNESGELSRCVRMLAQRGTNILDNAKVDPNQLPGDMRDALGFHLVSILGAQYGLSPEYLASSGIEAFGASGY